MELFEKAKTVCDASTFVEFVRALHADLGDALKKEPEHSSPHFGQANGWENLELERFLDAAVSWATDSDFATRTDENPWRLVAYFLLAGKSYE